MNELHIDDPGDYERLVHQSESERQALIDQVVVSESWFFRDEQPFQWLQGACSSPVAHGPSAPAAPGLELGLRHR